MFGDIPRILHPSDLSQASEIAFAHALRISLATGGKFDILHVPASSRRPDWGEFPAVRGTLHRWGFLPEGSPSAAVADLGIDVEKIALGKGDTLESILRYVDSHRTDLIVLTTHQREGLLLRWWAGSLAEPLARKGGIPTLFVPHDCAGFVSFETGKVELERILVPMDHAPSPQAAVDAAAALAQAIGAVGAKFTLLHVGEDDGSPKVREREDVGSAWERVVREGAPVQAILACEREIQADLIAMTTRGHEDFLDALRGSTTERVLRGARCPVLAIPAGARATFRTPPEHRKRKEAK